MMFVDGDSVYVEDKYSTQRLKRSVSPTREKLSKEQRKLKKHRLKLKDKEPEWLRISERLEEKMEEAVAQYLEHHPHVQPHRSPQHIASPEAVQQEGDTEMEEKEGEESSKGSQKPLTLPEPSGKQLEMLEFRKRLPAFAHSKDIVSKVSMHQVVVISGETGCGKTTQVPMWLYSGVYCRYSSLVFVLQVPQFLLDDAIERNPLAPVQIICTQPRRISAIGVAERVAAERGDSIGSSVGYQIRLERRASADTRLLFCTTGILLRRFMNDPLLKDVTHIIVDEIHERSLDSDFLLIILRDLLPLRPDLKVVLMSATLNAEQFSGYFNKAPVVHIPGK
ncbi:unnamed protein product [Symbiodinium sp. KB8]|nr:unnamed protein product [Symbiodinium sp. KB8]